MKYGSFDNLFMAAGRLTKPDPPAVGDGATFFSWTDRSAGTVTRVETGRTGAVTVYVRGDEYKTTYPAGYVDSEGYTPGTGPEIPITLRYYKRGGWKWVEKGPGGKVVAFGYRDAYRDPTF